MAVVVQLKERKAVKEVVTDVAEFTQPEGWRVANYTFKDDLERGEERLTIQMTRTSTQQGELSLSGAEPDEGQDEPSNGRRRRRSGPDPDED